MKVYVIETGEYSDRYVVAVTDSEETAQLYCKFSRDGSTTYDEYDTNEIKITTEQKEYAEDIIDVYAFKYIVDSPYNFYESDHSITYRNLMMESNIETVTYPSGTKNYTVYINKNNGYSKARKIARDIVMKRIAEDFNL